jgi:CRISPR-associated protein Csc3
LPKGLSRFTEQELARFSERNPDQSLIAHILNGLFAGLRLAERLPPEKAPSDFEQRLWILGYIVHDYTKVYDIKVLAGQLDIIREVIRCLGDDLSFDAYLPNWRDYLEDIVFLAQNTQKVEGANLNLRDYQVKTQQRRLDVLRFLSSYADVLVHIKSPSDVLLPEAGGRNTAEHLRKILDLLGSGRGPHLAYHKLSEVRGLLSNLIHNAVMAQMKEQECEPYLFFPSGTVYLADPSVKSEIDPERLANVVWERVLDIIADRETFGVGRKGTGFKTSPALYQLIGLAGVLGAGRHKAMGIVNSKAAARLYGFFTGESETDLKRRFGNNTERVQQEQEQLIKEQGLPLDVRIDRLGKFLTMVYRTVRENFKGGSDLCPILLEALELTGAVTTQNVTRQKGGIYFGWFYAAARYIQTHAGLDDARIEEVMRDMVNRC